MIEYNYKDKVYTLRNKAEEITLGELSKIVDITNKHKQFSGAWLEIIEMLGSKELAEVIDSNAFVETVTNIQINEVGAAIPGTIELGNKVYSVELNKDGTVYLTAKEMSILEGYVRKGGNWASKMVALVYKDESLSNNEHYAQAHIDHKAKQFANEIKADIAAPLIYQLNKALVENFERLTNANAKTV